MKKEELRIGNLIDIEGEASPVTVHWLECMVEYPDEADLYKPIPLTDVWLLDMGFEPFVYLTAFGDRILYRQPLREDTVDALILRHSRDGGYIWGFNEGDEEWPTEIGSPIRMEYVHQLQNFWFALTGEELTINKQ